MGTVEREMMTMGRRQLFWVLTWALWYVATADYSIVGYDPKDLSSQHQLRKLYKSWLAKNGKLYKHFREEEFRFEIFKNNLRFIDEHNKKTIENDNCWLGLNKFADLTHEEFKSQYVGSKFRRRRPLKASSRFAYLDPPSSIDWREKGAVTEVKDQGVCGSCWAFATIGSIEGVNKIQTGLLVSLSEQELVDCDTKYNQGCNGGLMDYAFDFIIGNGGIDTDEDYPYKAIEGNCSKDKLNAHVVSIDSYEDVPQSNEEALKKAVANQPVAVAIEAAGREFQFYSSGVFNGTCGTDLDHGVVVVGYGTDSGKDYWIVKNSWGENWGEKGFIRMERQTSNTTGQCGIAMEASYPVKKGANPPGPPGPPPLPQPPTLALSKPVSRTQCDNSSSCPQSNTCCCTYNEGRHCITWACCPLKSATCCRDGKHCCPASKPHCDTTKGRCFQVFSNLKNLHNYSPIQNLKHPSGQVCSLV